MRDWAKKKAGRAPGWLDPRVAYQDGQDDQDGDGDVVNVMVVMVVKMVKVVIIMIKIKMWGWAKKKMTNVQNPKVAYQDGQDYQDDDGDRNMTMVSTDIKSTKVLKNIMKFVRPNNK